MLLHTEFLSPQYVYPAHEEILRDVALWLLGRSWAPPLSVTPAALLGTPADSALPCYYNEAVHHALITQAVDGEAAHVVIQPDRSLEILRAGDSRGGFIIVTMDGRWWQSERLECGAGIEVLYRPRGRLRIDYSGGHTNLRVPWPGVRLNWFGQFGLPSTFEVFGRQWRVTRWEADSKQSWLHLVFCRALSMSEVAPAGTSGFWRPRPASVDIAWSALENALTNAVSRRSGEAIEQLHNPDLVPVGRAIFELAALLMSHRKLPCALVEMRLKSIRYLEAALLTEYGQPPWRILPEPVRAALLRARSYPVFRDLLPEVFEGVPDLPVRVTSGKAASGNRSTTTAAPYAACSQFTPRTSITR